MQFVTYQGDPGGRFGQSIPVAFWDFLRAIPGGWLTTMGYPIGPAFATTVKVNSVDTPVFVQAFERRVLTYTATNQPSFRVEFGNIGRHYYSWRYEQATTTSVTMTPTTTPTVPATTAVPTTRGNPPTVAGPTAMGSVVPGALPSPRP
jgi:hypothetical protein